MRTRRRLALSVLLAAGALAIAAWPVRATWWGGWVLAVAEAGIVGGVADWFAVTAIFRHPLGLPIPHTALIPANWERLAARLGTMVGERVLTRAYLLGEITSVDLAGWIGRAAERVGRADVEAATRTVLAWMAREVSPATAGELVGRLQRLIVGQPLAPGLARALALAHQHGWDDRLIGVVARALAQALDRPDVRSAAGEVVDDLLARYRERMGFYPRLALGVADLLGLVDRERIITAVHAGLRAMAADPAHPLRRRLGQEAEALARRLETDPRVAARVEVVKDDLLESPMVARLVEEAAAGLRRLLLTDLARRDSEVVGWATDRLERWRRALLADAALRVQLDGWAKSWASELIGRHHGRLAVFIEHGVHALGPAGAVRLLEEHAGDDLQYIRVNGTVVGGLAGGLLYALHLLLGALAR